MQGDEFSSISDVGNACGFFLPRCIQSCNAGLNNPMQLIQAKETAIAVAVNITETAAEGKIKTELNLRTIYSLQVT